MRKVIELADDTVSWLTSFTEFKIKLDPYGKSKTCKRMVHTPNKPPLTVAYHRNRHKKILEKEKEKIINRNLRVAVVILSPIQSATTPSDPSTMEGGVAMEEERTVVSIGSVSEVITVARSSEGSATFAPPEPKRAKAVAKPRPKVLIKNKGRGKGDIAKVDVEDLPEVPEVLAPMSGIPMDQTCEFAIPPINVAHPAEDQAASDISGISAESSQRGYTREAENATVISSDAEPDLAHLSSPIPGAAKFSGFGMGSFMSGAGHGTGGEDLLPEPPGLGDPFCPTFSIGTPPGSVTLSLHME